MILLVGLRGINFLKSITATILNKSVHPTLQIVSKVTINHKFVYKQVAYDLSLSSHISHFLLSLAVSSHFTIFTHELMLVTRQFLVLYYHLLFIYKVLHVIAQLVWLSFKGAYFANIRKRAFNLNFWNFMYMYVSWFLLV